MKNLLFYIAFLGFTAWAGNQLNEVPPPVQPAVVKTDTSKAIKVQEYPATAEASVYTSPH